MTETSKIYLDYAASTPICESALLAYEKTSKEAIGNPSSAHAFGRQAAVLIDRAREQVANLINAKFNEIIFTSGATEANNLAIVGLIKKFKEKRPDFKPHIITSKIEHSSVLESFRYLQSSGLVEVTFVGVDASGSLNIDELKKSITKNTVLISIIYANNETGVIQPLRKIGKIVLKENEHREREIWEMRAKGDSSKDFNAFEKIYFHTDAVQAATYLDCSVEDGIVDLMTLSGHKIFGPKGVGALYVRSGVPIAALGFGGDQELSLRPGTLNTPAIVAFGESVSMAKQLRSERAQSCSELKKKLLRELDGIKNIKINSPENSLPNILNFSVSGKSGERLMLKLDQLGFSVSTGSACSSGAVEPSHVLVAMGLAENEVESALRVSFAKEVYSEDIDNFIKALKSIV